MKNTDIHADDYALTINTSADILKLIKEGVLDSISIVPNCDCYDECMDMLYKSIPSLPYLPKMSVHLNLVEGRSLASGRLITATWKSLFIASFNPFVRSRLKDSLKEEISRQIEIVNASVRECIKIADAHNVPHSQKGIRIDSHQHSHMIPVVWEALTESIRENHYDIEYIRNSKEPLIPFLKTASLLKTYRPVNIIKNRILHFFSGKCDKYDMKHGLRPMYLWGLTMSGNMDPQRVEKLYRILSDKSAKDGRGLEILFHPGRMTEVEAWDGIPKDAACDFYLSANRDIEKDGAICAAELSLTG